MKALIWLRRHVLACVVTVLLTSAAVEIAAYQRDTRYVAQVAHSVVRDAGAETPREKVIALQRYLWKHVTFHGAPYDRRPFLRATAAETLRSGKGYCGEVSRAFICMAEAVGVRAQRINLWGAAPHVVAEAVLGPGERVIVDCQCPPAIADLEPLEQVMLGDRYHDYYNINLRRLRINWLVSRVKLEASSVTYWLERPHAIKATLWVLLAGLLLLLKGARLLARWYLSRRGWTHRSALSPQAPSSPVRPDSRLGSGHEDVAAERSRR